MSSSKVNSQSVPLTARAAEKFTSIVANTVESNVTRIGPEIKDSLKTFFARGATELARGLQALPDSIPIVDYPSIEASGHVHGTSQPVTPAQEHLMELMRGIQQQPYIASTKDISK